MGVARAPLLASALLPGAGHLLAGLRLRGALLLGAWTLLGALALGRRDRIGAVLSAVGVQEPPPAAGVLLEGAGVAVVALALLLAALWTGALLDLRVRRGPGGGASKGGPLPRAPGSQWVIAARRLSRDRLALAGLAAMTVLYLVTLLAPLIAPFDPTLQGDIVSTRHLPPSLDHPMGTDRFGRDIFSRVLYGARISLSIGFIAVGIGVTVGTAVGAVGGYLGGAVDALLMRVTDTVLAFPRLVLLIVVIALFQPSIAVVMVVLGLTGWMGIARIVRAEVLALREREFVQAARAVGLSDGRVILRHVLPNALAPVIVFATLGIGNTILVEASLSFLGLGVQPPTPSWGNMVSEGRDALLTAWWSSTFPGLAIVVTVAAFNLLGDGLRDALDPRLGGR